MTMLSSRIEHSSTTLLGVGEPRNDSENYIFLLFQVNALNHYTNLCLRLDIYMRGIDNFLKKLNACNSTSCAVNCDISH